MRSIDYYIRIGKQYKKNGSKQAPVLQRNYFFIGMVNVECNMMASPLPALREALSFSSALLT
jgi:hypothetical protein